MSDRVPDLWVERLALGELTGAQREDVERRLAAEEGGADRLEAIRASNVSVMATMPPRVFAAAVEQRAAAAPVPQGLRWRALLVPAMAALLALLVAVPLLSSGTDGTRAKGDARLQVHRIVDGQAAPLSDGSAASRGDRLQLSYTAAGAEFGAILSVDGRGTVTWHLPRDGRQSVRLLPGGGVPLDHSYELDDAPDFERFLLVTGPASFSLAEVENQVKSWASTDRADIELEAPLQSTLFSIDKDVP